MGTEWRASTIGQLCDDGIVQLQTGPFGTQLHAHDYVERGISVVPTEAIRNRRIDHSVLPKISFVKADELVRHSLEIGDILFARRGVQATGHIGCVREAEKGFICGTGAIRLRVTSKAHDVCPDYLSHVLANPHAIAWFKFHAIGATMPNLNEGIIRSFPLQLPEFSEQRAIAHVLGTLDDKIELNRRRNQTLEAMARALFKDWFVDFGPVRAKMERREPYLPPDLWQLFPDRLDIEGKPERWETKRVSDHLSLAYGKSLPSGRRHPGGVPVYGSGGITGFHNEALLNEPAVIVGRKGTVGSLFWEDRPCFPIDTVFFVQPEAPLPFCYYLLESLPLRDMNTDAAVPGLNRENVYRLEITAPPTALIAAFAVTASRFRETIAAVSEESETLTQLRDTLLPKLISGELRIGDAKRFMEERTQ